MQQYTDDEIIGLLQSSESLDNNKGLSILYRLFFPTISYFVKENSGKTEDAEDIFQEAILVLFNQIKKRDLILTCKLKTYFFSICRNLWLKAIKKNRIRTIDIQDKEAFVHVEASVFQSFEVNEEQQAMKTLLKQLGEDCQKVLLLFYYERLQMKEIAIRMNFANDQVARNKKVKCLKQLTTIMDSSPFFSNFFN